jgi:hypothetical protein
VTESQTHEVQPVFISGIASPQPLEMNDEATVDIAFSSPVEGLPFAP